MRYIDVCSGISAPTAAWKPLGWQALCYAEIDAAPRAVLQHHYPDTPLVGDFTQIRGDEYGPVDLLVGGTPCQSFSIAGLRGGLADERGNLALEYCRLADRSRARWLVWENVPGVLSSNGGRDFGSILGALAELGYGFAYRVLDAQHFGVPQRRRRVILVGYLGDWRRAAAVLFERHSLSGHPAPRREARTAVAALTANGVGTCGADDNQGQAGRLIDVVGALNSANGKTRPGDTLQCAMSGHAIPCGIGPDGQIARSLTASHTATGRLDPNEQNLIAFDCKGTQVQYEQGGIHPPLRSMGHKDSHTNAGGHAAVAFSIMPMNSGKDYKARETDVAQPVMAGGPVGGNQGGDYVVRSGVRRLTPRECERLQGFPDDFTLIPYRGRMMADGPRYKMLGNSMAVPVMSWIGQRIDRVEQLFAHERQAA
jgi:DNA (cytosine-5)-methyltransferase 1